MQGHIRVDSLLQLDMDKAEFEVLPCVGRKPGMEVKVEMRYRFKATLKGCQDFIHKDTATFLAAVGATTATLRAPLTRGTKSIPVTYTSPEWDEEGWFTAHATFTPTVKGTHNVTVSWRGREKSVSVSTVAYDFKFDPESCGQGINLLKNNTEAKAGRGADAATQVCGDRVFRSGVHQWTLDLTHVDNSAVYGYGVCTADYDIGTWNKDLYWIATTDTYQHPHFSNVSPKFNTKDRVVFTLDMDARTLSLMVNRSNKGVIFRSLPDAVKPFFWIYGQTVTLSSN
ncbi:hypothetical protein KIPB_000643 [Kipferlia bialata]|uniref:B30.2/SPRY domain-containing protein n=1 Tax=Kipferlia bialata TaxID=797122 RepID=A0A9K3GEP6_9EUKA|nr:hypothetical protein KIPB_000643 [Kipferlia bialata]|eukprot:g643.t1